jgi:hypothetical protein
MSRSEAAMKKKKTMEMMPFKVKNAAFKAPQIGRRNDEMLVKQQHGDRCHAHPGDGIEREQF